MRKAITGAAAIIGCLLLVLASRTVIAQQPSIEDTFRLAQAIETEFAEVETVRLEGSCQSWRSALSYLRYAVSLATSEKSTAFNAAAKAEYRTRLAEATARPCPPQLARPAPPAAKPVTATAVVSPKPLPRTVTLESLRLELAEACGARFDPARERLIAALDRAIRLETNPVRRRDLESDRAVVQRLKVPRCPSEGSATSATPPTPRQSFDALVDQLNDACGDSWSVLRLRTLAALDAAIAAERNPQELRNLNAGRTALLRRDPPPCQTATAEESYDDDGILVWFVASTYFNRDLLASEQARLAGNCARRSAMLKSAKEALALMRSMGDTVPSPLSFIGRLAAQELRPCPDPQNRVAASQVPVAHAPMSVPPSGSTVLMGPQKTARNCTSIDRSLEKGELTCRCLGKAQTLGIRGSNPYEARSSICNAAIHAGVLPQSGMGMVRVIPVTRAEAALGRMRNGIEPGNWDYGFENAFTVAAGGADPDDARPFDSRTMTGTFDTDLGPMVLLGGRGTFGRRNVSTITPTRIAGPVLEADWEEPNPLNMSACADGRYRGRLRFVFTRGGFTGLYARCDNNLNSTWNGTRRKTR